MIQFFSSWIEQIAIATIIASIIEIILPNGHIKKYVKVVLGIYIVFCMISPFVNNASLYNFDKNIDNYVEELANNEKGKINQENMDKRLKQLYIDELKNNFIKKIEEYGYEVEKCNIDAELSSISNNPGIHKVYITIYEKNKGITNIEKVDININETNIDEVTENDKISKLKQELANYYEIDSNVIYIKLK